MTAALASTGAAAGETGLGSVLRARLAAQPERVVSVMVDGEGAEEPVTAERLSRRAQGYALAIRSKMNASGRGIVAICLYHGLDQHAAWVGTLWAGHTPTIVAPPSPRMEPDKYRRGFIGMMTHMQAPLHIVDRATCNVLGGLPEQAGDVLIAEDVADSDAAPSPVAVALDDVALLQHSSGTTGLQKAIALTGRQVLAHNEAYIRVTGMTPRDRIVSWLPLYHDMGFIACFVLPLLNGIPVVEMSPFDWVRRPLMLLDLVSRHRAAFCWLPNFAFSFMAASARRETLPTALDLSCVRAWVNSSEPVLAGSFDRFVDVFGRFGVDRRQLTASYAMAENVYAVTQSLPGALRVISVDRAQFVDGHRVVPCREGAATLQFVSNGRPLPTTEVAIRDEAGRPLPEDRVGEIWIRGTHRFSGYFRRDDLTAQAIDAGGWYKTGDLGFFNGGELYVTGRSKDLIIIQGRNFYPGDLEAAAADVEGVVPGRVVVFGLTDEKEGTERLIILAESSLADETEMKRTALRIRNRIAQEFNCTASDVRVVPARWLIKSTAGKPSRAENRAKYLAQFAGT